MALVKCAECGREISDKSKVCMNCGNPINNEYCDEGTEKNINFFFKVAKVYRIIMYILAGLVVVLCAMDGYAEAFLIGLLYGGLVALAGFLSGFIMEWYAYVLKNMYEVNQNIRKALKPKNTDED